MFCNGGNQQQGGNYDAMISYSDKDLPIVLKYVVPNFESHANLRLFVRHCDDPQAGMTINAIKNSIANSGIAVCLVTKKLPEIRKAMLRIGHDKNAYGITYQ